MAILQDLRTGDPVMVDGDYVTIDNEYAFKQVVDNLLHCQLGTEILNKLYGFDIKTAIEMNSLGASPKSIQSLLLEALDPSKEFLIKNVDAMNAWRDGQYLYVKMVVTSSLGDITITLEQTIANVL